MLTGPGPGSMALNRVQAFLFDKQPVITLTVQAPQIMASAVWVEQAPDGNLDGFNSWGMGDTAEEALLAMISEQGY